MLKLHVNKSINHVLKVALFSTSIALLSGCNTSSSSSVTTKTTELDLAVIDTLDNLVIPAASNFQQQTSALHNSANNFCTNISEGNLDTLQQQWKETSVAWYQLLPFQFGPMINSVALPTYSFIDYYRLAHTDSLQTVRSFIDTTLAASSNLNDLFFQIQSARNTGLLALEITIFETADSESSDKADIILEFTNNSRKCELLKGYAKELDRRAQTIHSGWTTDYADSGISYRDLLINNRLEELDDPNEDGQPAISKLTVAVQNYYDYLANRNVTTDIAQLAGNVWQGLEASINSTEQMLMGSTGSKVNVFALLDNGGHEQDVANIKANLQTIQQTISDKNTVDFKAAAAVLDGNFKREIPDGLNVNLGLNFSDGD